MPAPHPLARRVHDGVLQELGTAMLTVELCEKLVGLGREDELATRLADLRGSLEQSVVQLRAIMAELRTLPEPVRVQPLGNGAA